MKNTVSAIWREKKKEACYLANKKKTIVRSKEKVDMYLKSKKLVQEHEKMFYSYLKVEKTGSQLFRA